MPTMPTPELSRCARPDGCVQPIPSVGLVSRLARAPYGSLKRRAKALGMKYATLLKYRWRKRHPEQAAANDRAEKRARYWRDPDAARAYYRKRYQARKKALLKRLLRVSPC